MQWWKWVLLALALIPIIALLDKENGNVSPILIFTIFAVVLAWERLQELASAVPLPWPVLFFAYTIIFGGLTQLFVQLEGHETSFSANPTFHFLQALTIYIVVMIVWYFLLRRYSFSLWQIYWITGVWGIVFEANFAILLTFNPLMWLFIFVVYGSFAALPYLLVRKRLSAANGAPGWKQVLLTFLWLTLALYVDRFIVLPLLGLLGLK